MTTSLPQYDPPSVLEITDLEFRYAGGPPVIEGCHLTVRSGEAVSYTHLTLPTN